MGGVQSGDIEAGAIVPAEEAVEDGTGQSETPPSVGAHMDEQTLSLTSFSVDPATYVRNLSPYQQIGAFSHSGDNPEGRLDGSSTHSKGGDTASPESRRDVIPGGVDFAEFAEGEYVGFGVDEEGAPFGDVTAGTSRTEFANTLASEYRAGK